VGQRRFLITVDFCFFCFGNSKAVIIHNEFFSTIDAIRPINGVRKNKYYGGFSGDSFYSKWLKFFTYEWLNQFTVLRIYREFSLASKLLESSSAELISEIQI